MSTGVFSELTLRSVTAKNRLALSPMCQYSAGSDGLATEWHRVHYGSRAVGGAGIVIQEATAVEPRGRITPHDLGLWNDTQAEALAPIASFVREQGAVPAVQLAHAGRKASKTRPWEGSEPLQPEDGGWEVAAPSAKPYPYEDSEAPPTERLDPAEIEEIVAAFGEAAERAIDAGFEAVEIHGAHGYLIHEFLSPVTNDRSDAYGGDFEGRTPEQAEALVRNGRADVAVIGRKLLNDPYFPHRAAAELYDAEPDVPVQYQRGF